MNDASPCAKQGDSGVLLRLRRIRRGAHVWCAALVLAVGIVSTAVAQDGADSTAGYVVDGVQIVGNRRIDTNAIRAQIKGQVGRISGTQIQDDIKTLYNTGFFDQVSVSVVRGAQGQAILKYTLTEKPSVRKVFIKGNDEVSESDLVEVLKLSNKRFVDRSKIQAVIRKAVSYYQVQGFYDVSFEYSTKPVGENEVDLTFVVKEGPRYRVRKVTLQGAQELDVDEVASKLQTRRYKWWNSWLYGTGRANQEMLEADKQIIRQFLLDNGFLEGSVGDASIEKREDGLYVVFDVTEGDQFTVGDITVTGDLIEESQSKTLEGIGSEKDDIFNASQVRNDIFTITDKFADQGYAFANVVPNTNLDKPQKKVGLEFSVAKGKPVTIDKIKVTGNEKTYDNVIRRELKVEEQQLYSASKIKRSQTLLQRLGYFDEVNISSQPTAKDPQKVDLDVHVKEATTGSFSAGAGYSSTDGMLFNTRLSENNILGTGRRLNLNLDFGTRRNNQVLSLDDPHVADTSLSAGLDLMRTDRRYSDFTREFAGGAVTVGYPLDKVIGPVGEDITLNTRYELARIHIKEVVDEAAQLVKDSEGYSTASSVTPSLNRNTINNPMNPKQGSRQTVSFEYAGLGGDQEFYLFEARNAWYYPLLESSYGDIVLSDRTQFGYGQSTNDDPFPLFKRYFPGGINSVRGFRNRTLGPEDGNGHEYGGSKQLVNNLELIFPLINSAGFKGVLFYDMGQAFDDNRAIVLNELRRSWGYGVRWASPLGPIRVEIGYPIARQDNERSPVLLFSFGQPL